MPVPEGEITTTETMSGLNPQPDTPYSVLNTLLWDMWQETLPESPGYMANMILASLEAKGWRIVK